MAAAAHSDVIEITVATVDELMARDEHGITVLAKRLRLFNKLPFSTKLAFINSLPVTERLLATQEVTGTPRTHFISILIFFNDDRLLAAFLARLGGAKLSSAFLAQQVINGKTYLHEILTQSPGCVSLLLDACGEFDLALLNIRAEKGVTPLIQAFNKLTTDNIVKFLDHCPMLDSHVLEICDNTHELTALHIAVLKLRGAAFTAFLTKCPELDIDLLRLRALSGQSVLLHAIANLNCEDLKAFLTKCSADGHEAFKTKDAGWDLSFKILFETEFTAANARIEIILARWPLLLHSFIMLAPTEVDAVKFFFTERCPALTWHALSLRGDKQCTALLLAFYYLKGTLLENFLAKCPATITPEVLLIFNERGIMPLNLILKHLTGVELALVIHKWPIILNYIIKSEQNVAKNEKVLVEFLKKCPPFTVELLQTAARGLSFFDLALCNYKGIVLKTFLEKCPAAKPELFFLQSDYCVKLMRNLMSSGKVVDFQHIFEKYPKMLHEAAVHFSEDEFVSLRKMIRRPIHTIDRSVFRAIAAETGEISANMEMTVI